MTGTPGQQPQKVLIIQLKRAGDVLLTTPVCEALRQAFPTATIDFLVEPAFASILHHNPAISHIQIYDRSRVFQTIRRIRKERYDWILDFLCSPRSAVVCLASRAAVRAGYGVPFWGNVYNCRIRRPGAGRYVVEGKLSLVSQLIQLPKDNSLQPRLVLTVDESRWAQKLLGGENNWVGVVPTHRHASRRWHRQHFAELIRLIVAQGLRPLIFWGPGEEDYVRPLGEAMPQARLIPPTSLRQMAVLLQQCRVVITNDNGPMHLATAVGVPTVTVYGPTDPQAWNPGGPHHRAVRLEGLSCLGCNLNACPFEHECMRDLSAQRVWDVAQPLLARNQVGAFL